MKKILLFSVFVGSLLFTGCSPKLLPKAEAYKGFYEEQPVAILIMPPINKTTNVEAKEFFHATLSIPLSNAGYYVIPPFLSMEIMKRESAYDAELFLNAHLAKFGEVFGADLALFTVINKWEKASAIGIITVEVEYFIKSIRTNSTVYQRASRITVNANTNYGQSGWGALVAMAAAAIQTATTNHAIVGAACNNITLQDLPAGPYSPLNGKDRSQLAGEKNLRRSVNGSAKQIAKETAKWYSRYAR